MDDESDAGVDEEVLGAGDDTGVEEDESLSSDDSQDDTDWKAMADKLKEERDNYKTALDQKRQLRKKPPTPVVVEEDQGTDDDESRPATVADIRKIVVEQNAQSAVDSILSGMVKDPNKREAVKLLYETRIRQTGTSDESIRSDLESALAIAEAPLLRKTSQELARAAQRDTTPSLSGGAADRGPTTRTHKFSADQVKQLTERAKSIGADPEKYIAEAWKNAQRN